uniref:Uncharacterized protein n=1 Tax=Micrurus corallinus TaxID=54390 RepID=A0A2D4FD36_MICCO
MKNSHLSLPPLLKIRQPQNSSFKKKYWVFRVFKSVQRKDLMHAKESLRRKFGPRMQDSSLHKPFFSLCTYRLLGYSQVYIQLTMRVGRQAGRLVKLEEP